MPRRFFLSWTHRTVTGLFFSMVPRLPQAVQPTFTPATEAKSWIIGCNGCFSAAVSAEEMVQCFVHLRRVLGTGFARFGPTLGCLLGDEKRDAAF
ncbi:MAG: hypothetical protein PHI97_30255 [Desulfobulbus sp.]|nr:hypothetical protein [Desulfobulbus sp.]